MAPTCKFYLQGNCRFGDKCRFEHPRNASVPNNNQNNNRFGALQDNNLRGGNNPRNRDEGRAWSKYGIQADSIRKDLTEDRPMWILSAYSPVRDVPVQLFGGEREQSFEEMRLRHYMAAAAGNPQSAAQEAAIMVQSAEQQIQNALSDLQGAINFIGNGEKEHPNRLDICKNPSSPAGLSQGGRSAFEAPGNSGFPRSSANTFGQSSAPSIGAVSFGQPSEPGFQANQNPFGAPSQPFAPQATTNGGGTFGQPTTLGQKSNPFATTNVASPFSQAPAPGANNAFGQPSSTPFGAPSTTAAGFGTASNLSVPSTFGAPSTLPTSNPFAASNNPVVNPFGAVSKPPASNATSMAALNPFGDTSSQQSPFAQIACPPPVNGFGAASNPFGAPSNAAQATPFGLQPATNQQTVNQQTGFSTGFSGQANSDQTQLSVGQNPYGPNTTTEHPSISTYTSRGMNQRLTAFKGRPVEYKGDVPGYRNANGDWEKIWFPDGPPAYYAETAVDNDLYDDKTEAAYDHLRQIGSFDRGLVPLLPPKQEWCVWDF